MYLGNETCPAFGLVGSRTLYIYTLQIKNIIIHLSSYHDLRTDHITTFSVDMISRADRELRMHLLLPWSTLVQQESDHQLESLLLFLGP